MLDVSLLKSHYLRGPLTKEQKNELITALRDNGIYRYNSTVFNGNYAFFILTSFFSGEDFMTCRIIRRSGVCDIPSHLKEISFEDLYVPEENMDFSKELFDLLGV